MAKPPPDGRGYNLEAFPDTGWAAVDGALVVGATATDPDVPIGGDIVTTESFTDFDLRFEFMLSEVSNSGVFYRVIEEEGAAIWHNAPEYQVLDDPAYVEMGTMDMNTHLTGDNYDLHASGDKILHGPGGWNEGRIRVLGNVVEHWLNGIKTVEYVLGSPEWVELAAASKFAARTPATARLAAGPIGLQDHGRKVWYRSISDQAAGTRLDLQRPRTSTAGGCTGPSGGTSRTASSCARAVRTPGYGYLATEQTWRDFDLRVDFRQEADGNSGVFFRSSVEGTTVSGWQAEVAPPGPVHRRDLRVVRAGLAGAAGSGAGRGAAHGRLEHDAGAGGGRPRENMAERDTRRSIWTDEKIGAAEGSIALQIHDGGGIRVRWRNIRVVDLGG